MAARNQNEGIEQAKVIAWAQARLGQFPELRFLFHCPNGGARNPVVAMQLTAMGVRKGVPDLLLPLHKWLPNYPAMVAGLAIEMKSAKGRLTPEQSEWFAHLTAQGWICTVCRTAEDAINALAAYLCGGFDKIKHVDSPTTNSPT